MVLICWNKLSKSRSRLRLAIHCTRAPSYYHLPNWRLRRELADGSFQTAHRKSLRIITNQTIRFIFSVMSPFHFPCHFFSNSNTKNRNQDEQQHPVPQKKTTETQQELIKEELQLKKVKVGRSELLLVSHTPSLVRAPPCQPHGPFPS